MSIIQKEEELTALKKTFGILADKVPHLIKGIIDGVYNSEESEKLAENTAIFYNRLVESGMDENKAFELTREFMKSRDVRNIVKETLGKDNLVGDKIRSTFDRAGEESGGEE
ncbi:MAG: hypothetical protein ACLFVS_03065 [Candidatus Acetothermia bacterium]